MFLRPTTTTTTCACRRLLSSIAAKAGAFNISTHYHSTSSSPLLPQTNNEPRQPQNNTELLERLRPLTEFWGINSQDVIASLQDDSNTDSDTNVFSNLTKTQLSDILSLPLPGEPERRHSDSQSILRGLYTAADAMCSKYHGDKVHYRGLLEFSNMCRNDCYYCGIRKSYKNKRYLLDEDSILEIAKWSAERGYGSIMLQSGEVRTPQRLEFLCTVIRRIVHETDLSVALSVGELSDESYQALLDAGASRYLLRIETSNPELFAKLHPQPQQTFAMRLDRLRALQRVGFMVGTGVMIGLPGQTCRDLADDLLFFREFDADMVGMGPYILQRDTPTGDQWLERHPLLAEAVIARDEDRMTPEHKLLLDAHTAAMYELTTRMIALARLMLGDANIAATTALQTLHPTGREVALMRGANILMPILTPTQQRENYQLYEGKVCMDESAAQCRCCLELRVAAAGKRIGYHEHGHPPHYYRRMKKEACEDKN